MTYKIKLQELFKKIKACATAWVSLHISSFLSDSSVTVLINIDFIFEIIFCSAPRLITVAKDKILYFVYTQYSKIPTSLSHYYLFGAPKGKKS